MTPRHGDAPALRDTMARDPNDRSSSRNVTDMNALDPILRHAPPMPRIPHVGARPSLAWLAFLLLPVCASAQELTPGAYWPLPGGLNVVSLVNSVSWGDVSFDPSMPVEDASATVNTTVVAYTRTLSIAGRSANLGVQVPVTAGHIEGLYAGTPTEVDRFGFSDPRISLGINLYGAPAMTPKEAASYRMRTIVGASVTVSPPLGEYDNTKVINLSSHRWSMKPEMGLAHAMGPWVIELMAGAWLFTDNTDFFGGRTREQKPIGSAQVHLTYRFSRRVWLAGDANFYTGGRTSVEGRPNQDLQKNSRVGSTFSWALDQHHSLRASLSRGAYTTIGADFYSIAVGYNYAWF